MKHRQLLTLTAATLASSAALAAPAALATPAGHVATTGPKVSVRVEGLTKTLLPAASVTTKAGSFTRSGQSVSNKTALGALNVATHGKWAGSYSSYGWFITSVLGEAAPAKTEDYWAFYVNGVYSNTGVGSTTVKKGASYLLAMVAYPGKTPLVSNIAAPSTATAGKPLTVKLQGYSTKGKLTALTGATVTDSGAGLKRGSVSRAGAQLKLTPTKAGKLTVTLSKSGYIRDEVTITVKK